MRIVNEKDVPLSKRQQYAELTRLFSRASAAAARQGVSLGFEETFMRLQGIRGIDNKTRRVINSALYYLQEKDNLGMEMSLVPGLGIWTSQMMGRIAKAYPTLENAQPIGFLFCDYRGLKAANTRYGHDGADKLLERLCRIMERNIDRRRLQQTVQIDRRTERRALPIPVGMILGGDELGGIVPRATEERMKSIISNINRDAANPSNSIRLQVAEGQPGDGSFEEVSPKADFGFVIEEPGSISSLQELFSRVYKEQIWPLKKGLI